MKRITKMTLFLLTMASLAGLAVFALAAVVKADDDSNTAFDVACDCRTGATLDGGVRGSPFIIQGKIFPAETLPMGIASNDPTEPVHVSPRLATGSAAAKCRARIRLPSPRLTPRRRPF